MLLGSITCKPLLNAPKPQSHPNLDDGLAGSMSIFIHSIFDPSPLIVGRRCYDWLLLKAVFKGR